MLRDLFVNFSLVVTLTSVGVYLLTRKLTSLHTWSRRTIIWLFLSGSSILLLYFPIQLPQGAQIDFRCAPIVLAGFYGGPGWGMAAALPVAVARWQMGGGGVFSGLIGILGTPLVGWMFRQARAGFDQAVSSAARLTALTFSIILLNLLVIPGQDLRFFWYWYPVLLVSYTGVVTLCAYLVRSQYLAHSHLEETEAQALTDHLTGLPNVRALEKDLRDTSFGYLLLIDVDHFKSVNDTYGHQAGDVILQDIAATIQASVRAQDLVCRYGGEEFAVLLRASLTEAALIAERVRTSVERRSFTLPDGKALQVTISGGLSPMAPGTPADPLAAADKLLYRAKEAGRNRILGA